MSRHVVLLRRDPSLGLALRALLHGTGRVTELGDIQAWPEVAAGSIDAVVVDLPEASRRRAIDLVRSRFNGRLVVVLDPADDPATVPPRHACSVVQRPFEVVELWQLVTTDPAALSRDAAPVGEERPAAAGSPEAEGGVSGGSGAPPVERGAEPVRPAASVSRKRDVPPPSPARGGPSAPQAPDQARPPAGDASTWKWRGQRYGPATAIPTGPPSDDEGTGGPSGAAGAKPGTRSGDQARARGALPRRSADSQPGATSAGTAGLPGDGAAAGAAAGGSAERPGSPVEDPAPGRSGGAGSGRPGPWPTPLPTRDTVSDQPAAAAPSAGWAGPERPSLLRRLAGRLGGRRPEVEVQEETPTDIRSASVPAFEPPAPPPDEASQRPTGPPVWPDSAAQSRPGSQSRPAPAEAHSRPSTPPAPRPEPRPAPPRAEPAASPPPKQPTPTQVRPTRAPSATPATEPPAQATPPSQAASPPASEPAAAPPTAAPAPAPSSGPSVPERAAGPTSAPSKGSRARGPMRPARPERPTRPTSRPAADAPAGPDSRPTAEPPARPDTSPGPADAASRQRRPSRPTVPADLPPSKPGPEAPTSKRPEPDAPTARPAPPGEAARPTGEGAAPAAARPVPPEEQPRPARKEPAPVAASAPDATAAVPDDPRDAVAAVEAVEDTAPDRAPAPAARGDADPAAVQAATAAPTPRDQAATATPRDQGAASTPRGSERRRRPDRRRGGEPPAAPAPPPIPVGEGDRPRPPQPAAQPQPATPAAASAAQPAAPPPAAPGEQEPEAAAKARPGSGPLGVAPDAPEALLAAEEVAGAPPGPMPGTFAHPPGTAPPGAGETAADEGAPERRSRTRRARSLLRFTAPKRPESTEREASAPDAATPPLADFDRLTASIESVTEALGGQPLEFYERDLPQIAAAETARRVRADVVVLLLDNGEGLMEVSGGVGLTPAERRLSVEYSRDVMRELFRAGVGLIEDTDRVRGALAGIPGSRAETLVMVPLVHERLGFGVLMAGRNRSQTGVPTEVFTDAEIEVLMGFADAAAASLRTAVLLRHLKGQLRALEEEG